MDLTNYKHDHTDEKPQTNIPSIFEVNIVEQCDIEEDMQHVKTEEMKMEFEGLRNSDRGSSQDYNTFDDDIFAAKVKEETVYDSSSVESFSKLHYSVREERHDQETICSTVKQLNRNKAIPTNTKMSLEQKYLLLEFVKGNELISKGKVAPNSTKELQEQWQIITEKLNACNGSKKSWKDWRRSWHDIRAKAKQKLTRIRRELCSKTEICPSKEERLTDFQKKVLSLMNKEAVHGKNVTKKPAVVTDEGQCMITESNTQSVIGELGTETPIIVVTTLATATSCSSASVQPTVIATPISVHQCSCSAKSSPLSVPNDCSTDSPQGILDDLMSETQSPRKPPLKRKSVLHSPYLSKQANCKKDSTKKLSISEGLFQLKKRKLQVQKNMLAFEKEKFTFLKMYKENKLKALQDIAVALSSFVPK